MYLLLLREPGADLERIEVEGELVIGRAPGGVVLADDDVSRRHASVRLLPDGALAIEDLSSSNGTHVNGEAISAPRRLEVGDRVAIGIAVFEVSVDVVPETRIVSRAAAEREATLPARPQPPTARPAAQAERTGSLSAASPPSAMPAAPFALLDRGRQGIASRRLAPTALTFAAIVATAVALVVYFAMH